MELTVKAHQAVRLDVYLREALVWKSRKRIQSLIRGGRITVNGRAAKPSQGVRGGDRVQVQLSHGTGVPKDYPERRITVIYEDRWLVAIDKPPGLLVHPVGRHVYDTLMNYLHFRYHALAEDAEGLTEGEPPPPGEPAGGRRDRHEREIDESVCPRLCHRIDKDTTGIVLVAKDSYVHQRVQWQFQNRKVEKEYLTLVAGSFPADRREIDLAIGEGGNLREALAPPLRPTLTRVRVQERFGGPAGGFSLVSARPVTGRQNQIRVHLAAIGHPVAGDTRYGGAAPEGFPARYLLHARAMRFFHPRLKCKVELAAPLPADFAQLLEGLRRGRDLPTDEPRGLPETTRRE